MSDTDRTDSDARQHFQSLLKGFSTVMLTTNSRQGELHARPMAVAEIDAEGEVWLVSERHAEKVEELQEDGRVNICMQKDGCYVALSGQAEVMRDEAHIKRLWSESFRVWFPKGPEDKAIVLIKVVPQHGEYWDNEGVSRAKYLYRAAKAYVTGTTPPMDQDLHGRVTLQN